MQKHFNSRFSSEFAVFLLHLHFSVGGNWICGFSGADNWICGLSEGGIWICGFQEAAPPNSRFSCWICGFSVGGNWICGVSVSNFNKKQIVYGRRINNNLSDLFLDWSSYPQLESSSKMEITENSEVTGVDPRYFTIPRGNHNPRSVTTRIDAKWPVGYNYIFSYFKSNLTWIQLTSISNRIFL